MSDTTKPSEIEGLENALEVFRNSSESYAYKAGYLAGAIEAYLKLVEASNEVKS